ncbi:hypothetical protein COCOBI_18-0390 [Coccomyxa sp. Obi]|nr:hypothetical protein COCOBI_18-0390 [Coccomyxa sp. Obi]
MVQCCGRRRGGGRPVNPPKRPWPESAANARAESGNGEAVAHIAAAHDMYRARRKQCIKASHAARLSGANAWLATWPVIGHAILVQG